jgi:hypothetical protein
MSRKNLCYRQIVNIKTREAFTLHVNFLHGNHVQLIRTALVRYHQVDIGKVYQFCSCAAGIEKVTVTVAVAVTATLTSIIVGTGAANGAVTSVYNS